VPSVEVAPLKRDVLSVLVAYPQIWHACHTHHQRGEHSGDPLTEREASVLVHVEAYSPASPKALAQHMGITKATMSALIDTLHERGFINRAQHATDRRRHELTLTKKGEDAIIRGSVLDAGRVQRALMSLPAAKRTLAVEGISLLAQACRELRS
jgi:DNA-binding MarR family transcriptional regulator